MEQADSVRGQAAERGAIPEAVNSQTLGLLRQQLGEAQRRATGLGTSLGPQHPELLAAQQTLRDAQRSVGEEIGRIRQSARAEFDRAVANEKAISTQVDQLKREALGTSRDTVELRELERELESNRAIYQAFLTRARETSEFERIDTSNARVITTATPPLERVGPQRRAMVTGAGLAGTARAAAAPLEPPAAAQGGASTAAQWSEDAFRTAATAQSAPESQAQADLMRVLRMMGQLEKAIDRYGTPR
jgi:polysaccharide biosynthesis transport protein